MLSMHVRLPVLLLFWAVPGEANSLYGQSQTVTKMAQAMTDSLSYLQLTDRQQPDILGLNTTAAGSLLHLKQKAKTEKALRGSGLFNQVTRIMQMRNKALSALLSPDQKKLFAQHVPEEMAAMKLRMLEKKSRV
jgi:hypothetical protein